MGGLPTFIDKSFNDKMVNNQTLNVYHKTFTSKSKDLGLGFSFRVHRSRVESRFRVMIRVKVIGRKTFRRQPYVDEYFVSERFVVEPDVIDRSSRV